MTRTQLGEHDLSSHALAARAEAERRAGRPEVARDLAQAAVEHPAPHAAAHVAYVLALVDCGDLVSAHRALERAYAEFGGDIEDAAGEARDAQGQPLAAFGDHELEDAFEAAEAQPDEMHDANHVAAAALEHVEGGSPEGVDLAGSESPFATETVAALLERQGHGERAHEVRNAARLRGRFRDQRMDEAHRERVVATLLRWLDNLRRRTA